MPPVPPRGAPAAPCRPSLADQPIRPIRLRIEVYASLRQQVPAAHHRERGTFAWALPAGATVAGRRVARGIAAEAEVVVGINGALGSRERALADGDEVVLLPPVQGGAALAAPVN